MAEHLMPPEPIEPVELPTLEQREQIKQAHSAWVRARNKADTTPEAATARLRLDDFDSLLIDTGVISDPAAWCEGCGLPFFAGDQFGTDEHGTSSCLENGPCLKPR